jgi:chromosomal replication initiation ATPase DnaA
MRASEIDLHAGELASARFIVAMVASAFAVSRSVLVAPLRGPPVVALARHVAIYLAHTRLHLSLGATADLFHRDRTTAGHSCRVLELRREDPALDRIVDLLERAVDIHQRAGVGA